MQKMKNDSSEVRAMLLALLPKVRNCMAIFDALAVENCLHGMRKMNSDSTEVRAMLSALAPKVNSCGESFDAFAICNCLYSMQGMCSDSAEVRAMLSALAPKVEGCKKTFNAQNMGFCLYGMQGMSSDHAEVRALLLALVPKVENCSEALNAQQVGNCLYGMQTMNSDSAEVCALLSALMHKVENCREALDAQAVGYGLYGLQGMRDESAYMTILDFLYDNAMIIAGDAASCKLLSCVDLVFLGQHLALTLPKLQEVLKDRYERWNSINVMITDELIKRRDDLDPYFSCADFRSIAEQRVYAIAKVAIENSSLLISSNEYLFNLFESDVVLRVSNTDGISISQSNKIDLIINIEVDGMNHKQEKKRFCTLRDVFLKSKGVVIERIETSALRRMNDKEVKEWVQERVKEAQN
jgi:hypothetical protein